MHILSIWISIFDNVSFNLYPYYYYFTSEFRLIILVIVGGGNSIFVHPHNAGAKMDKNLHWGKNVHNITYVCLFNRIHVIFCVFLVIIFRVMWMVDTNGGNPTPFMVAHKMDK